MPDTLEIYTFDHWLGADQSDPQENLKNLNLAIRDSATSGMPIFGEGKTYTLKTSATDPHLTLLAGAEVICAPGCILEFDFHTPSVTFFVDYSLGSPPASNPKASWCGGTFKGKLIGGAVPTGDVFNLVGNEIMLEDITVTGYQGGAAFVLSGDRIALVNPSVASSAAAASKGILIAGGSGFRCYDGVIGVSGDALTISPASGALEIADCAVTGTGLTSSGGRLIAIETSSAAISNVRLEGVVGTAPNGGTARAVSIVNQARATGVDAESILDISLRDITLDMRGFGAEAIYVSNALTNLPQAIANIGFDNIVIANPASASLSVSSTGTEIENLRWSGGGVIGSAYAGSCIDLRAVNGGTVSDLTLSAGTIGSVGAAVVSLGTANAFVCQNVVFSDVAITGAISGRPGVAFRKAINCGWSRGAISGATDAVAAVFEANSTACFVEEANLSGIGADAATKITVTAATYRLAGNYGSVQRSPVGFGAPTDIAMASTASAITVTSSYVRVAITGGTAATLSTITGGKDGDLLVLTTSTNAQTLTVTDGTPLRLAGTCVLANPNDTLTLLRRSDHWVEMARSLNG